MTINIIPGAKWGRRLWAQPIHAVPTTERQHFLVHYDGGTPITRTGKAVPQAVDKRASRQRLGWHWLQLPGRPSRQHL